MKLKEYPSIPKHIRTDFNIYAFQKYDGSNIRAEYSANRGFYKFGTKTRLLGPDEKPLGEAISLIKAKYASALTEICKYESWQRAIFFFEFFGPNSAFGQHVDEEHDVILFDAQPAKRGMLDPEAFLYYFDSLHIPDVLYWGKANNDFVESVRQSKLENIGSEGVVCKALKGKELNMFKIKTNAWLEKLKIHCGGDQKMFDILA